MALDQIPARLRFFTHPIPLGAVLVMALNDHWWKFKYGNFLTGKLSDFCGIFYFPIFLLALLIVIDEIFEWHRFTLTRFSSLVAIAFGDFLLILIKVSPQAARAIEDVFNNYLFSIQLIQDPTDLLALMMNPLTFLYLKTYWANSKVV